MSLAAFRQDGVIVRRVLRGKRGDFGVLVDRYLDTVKAVAYSRLGNLADAEDVAQEAFVKAYMSLHTLRRGESFVAWLMTISRNLCHHHQERRAREAEAVQQMMYESAAESVSAVESGDLHMVIRGVVMSLEEDAREVILLHYFAHRNTRQIADMLGISKEAAKKRLQRSREALGRQLVHRVDAIFGPKNNAAIRERVMLAIAPMSPVWLGAKPAGLLAKAAGSLGGEIMVKSIAVAAIFGAACYFTAGSSGSVFHAGGSAPNSAATVAESLTSPANRSLVPDIGRRDDGQDGAILPDAMKVAALDKASEKAEQLPEAQAEQEVRAWTFAEVHSMAGGNPQHTNASPAKTSAQEPGALWETPLGGGRPGDQVVMGPDGNLYVTLDINGQMELLSFTKSGQERWRSRPVPAADRTLSIPAVTPAGLVVVGLRDNTVRAFRQSDGSAVWQQDLGASEKGIISSPLVDPAGNVYIGAAGRNGFFKLNGATGELIWSRALEQKALTPEQQQVRDELKTRMAELGDEIADLDAALQKLDKAAKSDAATDADKTALESSEQTRRDLAERQDALEGELVAITGAGYSGSEVGLSSSPALSRDQRTLYIGYGADDFELPEVEGLYALDAATGAVKWRYRPEGAEHFRIPYASPLVGDDGTIYQQEQETSEILAIADRGDHAELKWKYNPVEPGDSPKMAAFDGDTLYVSTNPATMDSQLPVLTALSKQGELKWFHVFPGAYQGTTPVVTSNAVLQWTAEQNNGGGTYLYALDKATGKVMWRKQVSRHSQSGECEVVAPDGTVYMAIRTTERSMAVIDGKNILVNEMAKLYAFSDLAAPEAQPDAEKAPASITPSD